MNQINELQIYPAKLLLLLEKYDNASDKLAAKEDIKRYVTNFNTIKSNYEQVFSKTRIMANPAEYILDQNQHHLFGKWHQ